MTSETPHGAPRTPPAPLVLGAWTAPSDSPGGETPHTVTPLWDQALPASVWRGVLGDVEVRLETEGGPAALWAARDGHRRRLATDLSAEHRVRLGPDGPQWLWVEGPVSTVTWSVETSVQLPPITVVVPTRLREDDALTQAERFARMDCVHEVIVVDQGGPDSSDFALAAYPADHQPNSAAPAAARAGARKRRPRTRRAALRRRRRPVRVLRRMATFQARQHRTIMGALFSRASRPPDRPRRSGARRRFVDALRRGRSPISGPSSAAAVNRTTPAGGRPCSRRAPPPTSACRPPIS